MAALAPPVGELEDLQKKSNFKFEEYRTTGNQPNYNVPQYQAFPFPKPGAYPGLSRPLNPAAVLPPYPGPPPTARELRDRRKPVLKARKRVARKLEARHMRFARELGFGGNGVAALFYTSNISPPYNRKDYVVKCNHTEGRDSRHAFALERSTTGMFHDAMHMVQLEGIPTVKPRPRQSRRKRGLAPPDDDDDDEAGQWTPDRADISDVMFLEYCHRGSLHKALCKVVKDNEVFPNRALWMIKSCMAMAYPPLYNAAHYSGRQRPYRERFRADKVKNKFLHFDIEPKNILVCDPESEGQDLESDTGHPFIPRLKLSDLGLAHHLQEHHFRNPEFMLKLRDLAKDCFFAPEQFTEEWDFLPRRTGPWGVPPLPKVAGNFGWRTNLFQVGLVMACLIARAYPPVPPYAQRIRIPPFRQSDLDDDDDVPPKKKDTKKKDNNNKDNSAAAPAAPATPVAPAAPKKPDPPKQQPRPAQGDAAGPVTPPDNDAALNGPEVKPNWPRVWSYGGYLLNETWPAAARVDRPLRLLVAQCLCDDPYWRPRMKRLDWLVRHGMWRQGWRDEGYEDDYGDSSSDDDNAQVNNNAGDDDDTMRDW
ncbi:hypothetical protein C8A00DRAFT_39054, partial [Chaetomidium leptoderma]